GSEAGGVSCASAGRLTAATPIKSLCFNIIYLPGTGLFRLRFGLFLFIGSVLVGPRGRLGRRGRVRRSRVLGRRLIGGRRFVGGGAARRRGGGVGRRRRSLGRRFFAGRGRGLGQGGEADGRCADQKHLFQHIPSPVSTTLMDRSPSDGAKDQPAGF